MTTYDWTLFGQNDPGTTLTSASQSEITQCMQFSLSQNAGVTGIWWYSVSGATILPQQVGIFLVSTQALILVNLDPVWSGDAGSGWVMAPFDGQFVLFADTPYQVAVYSSTDANYMGQSTSFWVSPGPGENGLTNGIITAPGNDDSAEGQNSYYLGAPGLTYPNSSSIGNNNWIDIQVTTGIPAPSPPTPGFALESPRTWSAGDLVTTPRLRADMYNLAALTGQARPMMWSTGNVSGIGIAIASDTNTLFGLNALGMNSWNTVMTQGGGFSIAVSGTATFYPVPLTGWYLIQGWIGQTPQSGGASDTLYTSGVVVNQGTAAYTTRTNFADFTGTSTGAWPSTADFVGQNGMELLPFNQASGDCIAMYAYSDNSSGSYMYGFWSAEWVGLPESDTVNNVPYDGPTGVLVRTPKPASLWPAGPGGTLSASVAAGGTVLALPPTPGLRAGQVIGIDWQNGSQAQVYGETATVQSIAGTAVTLTGSLSFAHNAGAPVTVPVSAAFLNEQVRDQSDFWFYPPMLRAIQGTASQQSIPSATWTTVDLALSGSGITNTIDNYSGFDSNVYTIPVSGQYQVMGQVYFAGSEAATTWGARLIDNNGNTYWGDFYKSDSTGAAVTQSPAVRRVLRLTEGQTIALQCYQNSGSAVDTAPTQELNAGGVVLYPPRLIAVFRAF